MYGRLFYQTRRHWTRRAASVVLPRVLDIVRPCSLVDVGCGTGIWVAEAMRLGVHNSLGLDGPWVSPSLLEIPPDRFRSWNLQESLDLVERFDLAISLEVAEHLAPARARGFVESLCKLSPVVMFSAAIPGQGGENHRNEQWPSYWIGLFASHGFAVHDVLRPALWRERTVPHWYRQNVLLFASETAPAAVIERISEARAHGDFRGADLVHPEHASRALQYPGVGQLVRAFPYAMLRSLSRLGGGGAVADEQPPAPKQANARIPSPAGEN